MSNSTKQPNITPAIPQWQSRTALLATAQGMHQLTNSRVLVVGLGGVGGAVVEMLARAGVGHLTLVDADVVQPSNINRQLIATHTSVGKGKAELWAERLRAINPNIQLKVLAQFITPEDVHALCSSEQYHFAVDAIDTLAPKTYLIRELQRQQVPFVSSMGAGGRWDPTQVHIGRLDKVVNCKLARILRKRLRHLGCSLKFTTVYSTEKATEGATVLIDNERHKKSTSGTISYLPTTFGCYIASVVIRSLVSTLTPPPAQP